MALENERKARLLSVFLQTHEIPKSNWYLWDKQGKTPPTFKIGKRRLIWEDDALAWLASVSGGAK